MRSLSSRPRPLLVPRVLSPRGLGLRLGDGRAPVHHARVRRQLRPVADLLGRRRHREVLRMTISTPLVRRLATSLIVVGVLAAWLGQPGPDRKVITVEFARAGLNVRPGDEVRVRGVPVGTIASLDIHEDAYIARYRPSEIGRAKV